MNLNTTFAALAKVARPFLQDVDHRRPRRRSTPASANFPTQRVFLANTERLFADLRPGIKALSSAAPDLADALTVGTGTLRRSVAFAAV